MRGDWADTIALQTYKSLQKILTRDGQTILDSTGKKINHPAWARKRDARAQMLRYASEFGLTPSAQSKVSVVAGPVLEEGIDPRIFG